MNNIILANTCPFSSKKELIFTDKNKKQVAEINAINVIDLKTNRYFCV